MIGSPFKNYFTEPERAEEGIQLVLREEKVTNYELTVRSKDGRETVVSYNAATFLDRERKLQGVFAATLLAVNNCYENIEVLRAILEPTGIEVLVATGVAKALACAYQSHPDLILSDVALSGETGYDLIKAIRADPKLRNIPFLFISSTNWGERESAYALCEGAAAYIVRPIEPDSLLAQINQWLKSE